MYFDLGIDQWSLNPGSSGSDFIQDPNRRAKKQASRASDVIENWWRIMGVFIWAWCHQIHSKIWGSTLRINIWKIHISEKGKSSRLQISGYREDVRRLGNFLQLFAIVKYRKSLKIIAKNAYFFQHKVKFLKIMIIRNFKKYHTLK